MREKRGIERKVPVKVGKIRLTREKRLRPSKSKFLISNFKFLMPKFLNKSKTKINKTKEKN